MVEEEKPEEESYLERRRKYNELRLSGVSDKEARERVWPRTGEGVRKKESEEKKEKTGQE